jgi:starvation-inducible outer membrane lipoprotein
MTGGIFPLDKETSMKKIIAALLIGIFSFSLFACVTNTNKLDRAKNANRRAQREMNRVNN